nr:innexin inx2-like [Penaeus vannamei]
MPSPAVMKRLCDILSPFLFQGLVFYIPHWLWKRCEGGRLRSLSVGLSAPFMDKELRLGKIQSLARYLHTSLHQHSTYAVCYFVCETLNLVVCFFNLWFMDMFLGGAFSTHGLSVMDLIRDNEDAREATNMAFPRATKCIYHVWPSGSKMKAKLTLSRCTKTPSH